MCVLRCIYFIDIANCRCCLVFPAPRPHHPNCRSGHCDEAREHFGVRQTRDSFGPGRWDVRVIRQGWHVDTELIGTADRPISRFICFFFDVELSSWWGRQTSSLTRSFSADPETPSINQYIWKVVLESAVLDMTCRNHLYVKQLPSLSISLCNFSHLRDIYMYSFTWQRFLLNRFKLNFYVL